MLKDTTPEPNPEDLALPKRMSDVKRKQANDALKPLTAKQLRAVAMLASGLSSAETSQCLGVKLKTIHNWSSRTDFKQAVIEKAARLPKAVMSREFEENFGIFTVAQLRDLILQQMVAAVLVDPADFQDENGELLPLCEVPEVARMAIQEIGHGKRPHKLVDRLVASRQLMVSLGLQDQSAIRSKELKEPQVGRKFFKLSPQGESYDDRELPEEHAEKVLDLKEPDVG